MSIKVTVRPKYGQFDIDIPVNTGEKLYPDSGKGLSDLFAETFTIFMQIPTSQTQATVRKWIKHTIRHCDRRDGIFDKSTGTMAYKANSWTVMCKDWQTYKKPLWVDGGYYTLPDYEKEEYWTANVGDLVVFADVEDVAPTSTTEFNALRTKYKDNGGQITSAQEYINYRPNGKAWQSNHIEMIKG